MIIGISAGGRAKGETAKMVKGVLEESGLEYEYVSLAGKSISGCRGCLQCAGDGVCKYEDDWNSIADVMKQVDAIVFGAPTYCFNISALGHAFLERTYALRHGRFLLGGKFGVVVTPGEEGNPAQQYIEKMMVLNKMAMLCTATGESSIAPCYHCGYGEDCMAGGVVKRHGNQPVDEITPDMYPPLVDTSEEIQKRINAAGWMLAKAINKD